MRDAGSLLPLALAAIASAIAAQNPTPVTVALPHATGTLEVPAGWTALGPVELGAESRASDPAEDPGRQLVTQIAAQLRRDGRTSEHVLLHGPGAAPGQVRLVNAYSAAVSAKSADLQRERSVDQVRRTLEEGLAAPGVEIVYLGSSEPELFAVGSISLTFRITVGGLVLHNQMHVVPAGERLQYFETQFSRDDMDAPVVIGNVLRTFTGAAEPVENDTLTKMLIGGAAGAIAGIMVALLRRGRRKPRIGVDDAPGAETG